MTEIFFPIGEYQNASQVFSPGRILTMNQYDILIEMIRDLQSRLDKNTESLRNELSKHIGEQEKSHKDLNIGLREAVYQVSLGRDKQKEITEDLKDLNRQLDEVIKEQVSWKLQFNGAIKLISWIAGAVGILWFVWEKLLFLLDWIKTE